MTPGWPITTVHDTLAVVPSGRAAMVQCIPEGLPALIEVASAESTMWPTCAAMPTRTASWQLRVCVRRLNRMRGEISSSPLSQGPSHDRSTA
jgi:hypothetical protein